MIIGVWKGTGDFGPRPAAKGSSATSAMSPRTRHDVVLPVLSRSGNWLSVGLTDGRLSAVRIPPWRSRLGRPGGLALVRPNRMRGTAVLRLMAWNAHGQRARAAARTSAGLVSRLLVLRIGFGLVWALDAYLKWQPAFVHEYAGDVGSASKGQPDVLRPWFHFWRRVVEMSPHGLAYATAVVETLIAAGLLLGLGRRVLYIGGAVWSLAIWTIPEGFGGSFVAGATDIGTAIMYAFLFFALYSIESLPAATDALTLDRKIERRLGVWRVIGEPGGRRGLPAPATLLRPGEGREAGDI